MVSLVVAALLLLAPGLVLAWTLRIPAYPVFALAPAASTAMWAVAAALLGVLGQGPTPAATGGVVLLGVVVAWLVGGRRGLGLRRRASSFSSVATPVRTAVVCGVAVATGLAAHVWFTAWSSLDAIPRFSDDAWHGYVVGLLSRGVPANPFTMVPLDPAGIDGSQPYPWGAHVFAALVQQLSGGGVPVALKATQLAFVGVAYPLGCAALAVRFARGPVQRVVAGGLAPVVAMGFMLFPWRTDQWLVFPCAIALIPGTTAGVLWLADRRSYAGLGPRRWRGTCLTALAVTGVTVVHPAAAVAMVVLVLACVLLGGTRFGELAPRLRSMWRLVPSAAISIVLGGLLVGRTLLLTDNVVDTVRPTNGTFGHAAGFIVAGEVTQGHAMLAVVVLGCAVLAVLRRVMLGPILYAAIFVVLAASARSSTSLHALTGLWFNDGDRLGALAAVVMPVLVGTQAGWVVDIVLRTVTRRATMPRAVSWVLAPVAVVVAVALTWGQLGPGVAWVRRLYVPAALTSGDEAAFAWLRTHAAGHRVMNPVTYGHTGWMYALDGVDAVNPHTTQAQVVPWRGFLALCLNRIDQDPRVRPLVESYDIKYVYVPGPNPGGNVGVAQAIDAPGLVGLDDNPAFTPVQSFGQGTVYEVHPDPVDGASTLPARQCVVRRPPSWWLTRSGRYAVRTSAS